MDHDVIDVTQAFEHEYNKQRILRKDSEDNFDMVRGNQWVRYTDLEEKLKKKNVPVLNLNLILPVITAIIGNQINNRYDLKAYGVRGTSQDTADLITRLLNYFLNFDTDREFTHATLDALISNLGGYLAIDYTTDDNPFGGFKIKRESSFYHLRDSSNESYDINEGGYHLRTKWLTIDNLKAQYPNASAEIEKYTRHSQNKTLGVMWSDFWQKISKSKKPTRLEFMNEKDNTFRVLEKWDLERKKMEVIVDMESDKLLEVPKNVGIRRVMSLLEKRGLGRRFDVTTINKKTLYVKTVLGGIELIQDKVKYDIQVGMFPFTNLFTFWIDGQGMANVENLKDYQEEHNKRSVNILQILNSTANSGWWVRQFGDGEMQTDIQDLTHGGQNFGSIMIYKGSRPPEKIQANQLPTGHVHLDEKAIAGIRATGMVGENFQGRSETAGESGKLFNDRVKQNLVSMQMFTDNILYSYKIMARYLVKAIPQKLTKGQTFDIIDEENDTSEQIEINTNSLNTIANSDFEVVLTPVNSAESAKQQEWMEKQAMVSQMPPELVPWHLYVASSPYKDAKLWAKHIEGLMGSQAEGAKKTDAVDDALKVAQVQNLLADSESKVNAGT